MHDPNIIGESPAIRTAIETALKYSSGNSITTLIVGENGTGKQLFAQLMHDTSEAAGYPFVDIHCGSIPGPLLESELFGHEKGSFTGAYSAKNGLLEISNGGTVFLDEINSMPLGLQNKLLKAVETKKIRRVGGIEEIDINTRIIAAANIDLAEAVRKSEFREDLYYRLNVGRVNIPPLRDRSEDVLILADHFIAHYNKEHQRSIKGLAPQTKELFKRYSWPGNVRELQNVLERGVILSEGDLITEQSLPLDLAGRVKGLPSDGPFLPLKEVERQHILAVLQFAAGSRTRAAEILGIGRKTLYRKLQALSE